MIELPGIEESRARPARRHNCACSAPSSAEGRAVALHGESIVRIVAGELHRPPDHDVAGAPIDARPAMAHEGAQEGAQQVLEAVPLAEDPGLLEGRACRESLEGLDEPVGVQPFQELVDGPGSALHMGAQAIAMPLVPEAHGGHIDLQVLAAMVEGQRLHAPVRIGDGHDRVAGAEIDADGQIVGTGGMENSEAERRAGRSIRPGSRSQAKFGSRIPSGTATPALRTAR